MFIFLFFFFFFFFVIIISHNYYLFFFFFVILHLCIIFLSLLTHINNRFSHYYTFVNFVRLTLISIEENAIDFVCGVFTISLKFVLSNVGKMENQIEEMISHGRSHIGNHVPPVVISQ